jgi:hypothetical protein
VNGSCSYDGLWMKFWFILTNFIKICHKKDKRWCKNLYIIASSKWPYICERSSSLKDCQILRRSIFKKSCRCLTWSILSILTRSIFLRLWRSSSSLALSNKWGWDDYCIQSMGWNFSWIKFVPKWEWPWLLMSSCWSASICWGMSVHKKSIHEVWAQCCSTLEW